MSPSPWRPSEADSPGDTSGADVYSPDRSVRIAASPNGEVAVEVQGLHRHSEDSLARQVRAAVRLALASLQPSTPDVPPSSDQGQRG